MRVHTRRRTNGLILHVRTPHLRPNAPLQSGSRRNCLILCPKNRMFFKLRNNRSALSDSNSSLPLLARVRDKEELLLRKSEVGRETLVVRGFSSRHPSPPPPATPPHCPLPLHYVHVAKVSDVDFEKSWTERAHLASWPATTVARQVLWLASAST